ncbi:MAG: sigma-54-dependent transcriptional regulator [Vicinamibacterales bacterium]
MILVIDDDQSVTASLSLLLKQGGHASRAASSPEQALDLLRIEPCQLVIQDMNFSRRTSGDEGLDLLRRIKSAYPHVPVILITAWGSIPLAVEGMKAGASDFVTKPWTNQQMLRTVETILGISATKPRADEPLPTREDLDSKYDFGDLLGSDPRLLRILQLLGRVAATDASVLITGESGTGKELVADAVHRNSRRAGRPFVKVNLGGIATTLFESEMFGHVRGAFTDARTDRKGRFEIAHGGTIFLDEIGDLDPAAQVKLLRVLQDRRFEVLGSSQTREVDVRVIAATNRNLPDMVSRGDFREDLLYRINLIPIHLPPLRERRDDIPRLAAHFLQAAAHVYRRDPLTLSGEARRWLQAQPWPGNVRQLHQTIERAVLVSSRDELTPDDFAASPGAEAGDRTSEMLPPVGSMTMDDIERAMIEKALKHHARNLSKAADSLGLSRAALYRRLEKYGLDV